MDLKQFELGVVDYIGAEVIPAMPSQLEKWLGWAAVAAFGNRAEQLLERHRSLLESAGVIQDGEVDLDRLEQIGLTAFARQPDLKIWKFTLRQDDFKKLLARLRQ